MTGPTPAAASRALRDALQLLLSSVSTVVLRTDATGPSTLLTARDRVRRATGGHIGFFLLHAFATVSDMARPRSEQWQTHTAGYHYRIEDADGREIVAYHWHPHGPSHVETPHLHLGAGLGTIRSEMAKAHLPTGIVTPAAMVSLAVEHFGVEPRRRDWAAIIERVSRDLAPS